MDRRMMLLIIGLIFGSGIGFLIAASYGVTLDGHDHATDHGSRHNHAALVAIDLPADANAPTLAATLHKDPMSGWNLQMETTNFRFSPENASLEHIEGEGHAHVYVNGKKLARVYGDWFHIDHLPENAVVEVELNSNDHRPLAVAGTALRIIATE